ncbi:MAG: hypothetical protein ACPHL6_08670 [Rubripirellula sp.]
MTRSAELDNFPSRNQPDTVEYQQNSNQVSSRDGKRLFGEKGAY